MSLYCTLIFECDCFDGLDAIPCRNDEITAISGKRNNSLRFQVDREQAGSNPLDVPQPDSAVIPTWCNERVCDEANRADFVGMP